MKYSLRQLEVFLAVAHYDNISRAAESLSMSQSAASSALKELEYQFDIQLFDRIGKRLQINELGKLLRPKAEYLLAQAKELEADLFKHQTPGNLTLGATLTIGDYLAVDMMAEYMSRYPGRRVQLLIENTTRMVEKLINYDLDIGLLEGEVNHPDLDLIPWIEDQMVVVCSPSHPLAKNAHMSDQDVLQAKWILRESGSGTRQGFDRAMHGLLPQLNILLELQHTGAIKRAVKANLGISCLSSIAVEESIREGSLVQLNVPGKNLIRRFYIALHRHKYRSAGIEQWLAMCLSRES